MAVMLAPYNNAMRLGQGFNSYTQQICLNGAVLPPKDIPYDSGTKKPSSQDQLEPAEPQDEGSASSSLAAKPGVSQIVSYSSRFVDKLSDMTDAMNISASLSIKTATIGGKASGNFIDSDKFKESDLNFFIQVKVVNQKIFGEEYSEFQNLDIPKEKFTEVYGDSFISGFEEGGELNALISVKVSDKNKTFAVKAALEASLGTPALSGEVTGSVDMEKSEIKSSTETTVTVNWSGGGQIKPSDATWDVNTLTLAACNFPDLVAQTPQRTYAILTKYTALKSFYKYQKSYSVLDYENAGVYTSALLDSYMDYKSIWKQIQLASFELKNRRADMKIAKPSDEVLALKAEPVDPPPSPPPSDTSKSSIVHIPDENKSKESDKPLSIIPNTITYKAYPATVLGLEKARRDCRNEMIKIVDEVDQVTKDPSLALQPAREDRLVSPRVFTQLLPIVILRPIEGVDMEPGQAPKNPLILGETDEVMPKTAPPKLYNANGSGYDTKDAAFLQMISRHASKARSFYLDQTWGGSADVGANSNLVYNDLDLIDGAYMPSALHLWHNDTFVRGIRTTYKNEKMVEHGDCSGTPSAAWPITDNGASFLSQIVLHARLKDSAWGIYGIRVVDDTGRSREYPDFLKNQGNYSQTSQVTLAAQPDGLWSFRGWWGAVGVNCAGLPALGAVWGRDSPESRFKMSTADPPLYEGPGLTTGLSATAERNKAKSRKFRMTHFAGNPDLKYESTPFNDLDTIGDDWHIKRISFFYDNDEFLTGYAIEYHNGKELSRGPCTGSRVTSNDLRSGVNSQGLRIGWSSVWIRSGSGKFNAPVADHVRLLSNTNNVLEAKPTKRASQGGPELDALAPETGFTVRGFYGSYSAALDRLGVIWGKD